MIAIWTVRLKTGYNLKDGELARIRELITEDLSELAEEYIADISVQQSYSIPGPLLNPIPAPAEGMD